MDKCLENEILETWSRREVVAWSPARERKSRSSSIAYLPTDVRIQFVYFDVSESMDGCLKVTESRVTTVELGGGVPNVIRVFEKKAESDGRSARRACAE